MVCAQNLVERVVCIQSMMVTVRILKPELQGQCWNAKAPGMVDSGGDGILDIVDHDAMEVIGSTYWA